MGQISHSGAGKRWAAALVCVLASLSASGYQEQAGKVRPEKPTGETRAGFVNGVYRGIDRNEYPGDEAMGRVQIHGRAIAPLFFARVGDFSCSPTASLTTRFLPQRRLGPRRRSLAGRTRRLPSNQQNPRAFPAMPSFFSTRKKVAACWKNRSITCSAGRKPSLRAATGPASTPAASRFRTVAPARRSTPFSTFGPS